MHHIWFEGKRVGQVRVKREGLYYRLDCLAKVPGSLKYRLIANWEDHQHDFGLCIPNEDGIGMTTRIPIKSFTGDAVVFELKDYHVKMIATFIPLRTQEPFPFLERLENAYLECRNGITGLCFHDQSSI